MRHTAISTAHITRAIRESRRSARRGAAGMTLMEIMIVLAILALVMGFLFGPAILKSFGSAKTNTAKLMAKDYYNAYTLWSAENSEEQCPESLEALSKFRNKKDDKDPWGRVFVMKCGEDVPNEQGFGVSSPGENGKEGDEDDIHSWD